VTSLTALRKAETACRRPLYKTATQAVPGEGARDATIMLVGEQPGDKEDTAGKPFGLRFSPLRRSRLRQAFPARRQLRRLRCRWLRW
jgi:DNA polymerase